MILNPEKVMIDFELAAKKAFEIRFNRIRVIGCLFHFGQVPFKNVLQTWIETIIGESNRHWRGIFARDRSIACKNSSSTRILEDSGTFHTLQPRIIQIQHLNEEVISLITVTQPPSSLIENLQEQLNKSNIGPFLF